MSAYLAMGEPDELEHLSCCCVCLLSRQICAHQGDPLSLIMRGMHVILVRRNKAEESRDKASRTEYEVS